MEAASAMVLILDAIAKIKSRNSWAISRMSGFVLDVDQGHQGLSRTPPMTSIQPAVAWRNGLRPYLRPHLDATCVHFEVDAGTDVLDADRYEALVSTMSV